MWKMTWRAFFNSRYRLHPAFWLSFNSRSLRRRPRLVFISRAVAAQVEIESNI